MLAAIKDLALARYKYVLGEEGALDLAKKAAKKCSTLDPRAPDQKQVLEFALDTYDTIKNKTKLSSYEQIDYMTSKILPLLLLPFPKCGLPLATNWTEDKSGWVDPEFPPQEGWQRLHDIPELVVRNPEMKMLQQGEVMEQAEQGVNCSLVSSMVSISSFDRGALAALVYPKGPDGHPQYTESGHYIVKLQLGGVWRMVDIDDYIPWRACKVIKTKYGSLVPILVEKAYLKMMGGYDFRGSNSALDTYQLFGGIPLFNNLQHHYLDRNIFTYDHIYDLFKRGHALLCVGTGPNAPPSLERNHDFAVVDMKLDHTLTLINPWSDKPKFYSWAELLELFHVLYLSFTPAQYQHVHQFNEVVPAQSTCWHEGIINRLPQYLISNNSDQPVDFLFTTAIKPTSQKISAVLKLLALDTSTHAIFAEEAPVWAETPEVEALCLSLAVTLPPHKETVVVVRAKDIVSDFSTVGLHIRISSKAPVATKKLTRPLGIKVHRGLFPAVTGRYGTPHYLLNPLFEMRVTERCNEIRIFCFCPESFCQLVVFNSIGQDLGPKSEVTSSGPYSSGIQFVVMYDVQPGSYTVVPSLYEPSKSPFYISCVGDSGVKFDPKPRLTSGYFENTIRCTRQIQTVRVISEQPARIIAYISANCHLEVSDCVVDGYFDLEILWKSGEHFDLDVFSETRVRLEPQFVESVRAHSRELW